MSVYNTPMGNQVRLRSKGAMVESGAGSSWSYSGAATGVPNTQRTGIFPGILRANENGSIAVKLVTAGELSLALHKSVTQPSDGTDFDFRLTLTGMNNTYQPVKPGQATPTNESPLVNDIVQMRREDTTIVAEISHDNGATWINLVTWTGIPATQTLTGMLFLGVDTSVSTVYSKGFAMPAASDVFTGIAAGTSLSGRAWVAGETSWPANGTTRLKADGNGYVYRDLSQNDVKAAALVPLRFTDKGVAVFFKHTNTDETLSPGIALFTTQGASGVQVKIVGGQLIAGEYSDAGVLGRSMSVAANITVGQEYCIEVAQTTDASNQIFNFRVMLAPGAARTSLLAQGTLTTDAVPAGSFMAINGVTTSSELDPISRVELLDAPFAIVEVGGPGTPKDDGTTITSLIGAASDCHFPDPVAWWSWMTNDLVTQKRKHVGLFDKTKEFVYEVLNFDGKTTSAEYNIVMKPRPGHAWYEHPDFLTGPLRYNKDRGVAFAFTNQYNNKFNVSNEYVTMEGFQVQFRNNWGGGVLVFINSRTSSMCLNLVDTGVMAGRWTVGVKTFGKGNYGNIVWVPGTPEFAVHHDTIGSSWENNTIVAASDGGAGTGTIAVTTNNGSYRNNAIFGFKSNFLSYYGTNVDFINCATDLPEASAFGDATGKKENNLSSLKASDVFMNVTSAGCDLRVKVGSPLYNAGGSTDQANTRSINGLRIKQGVVDIGAWEAPRLVPSKLVVTGKATTTTGYTTTIRVALNQSLVDGESQPVTMSDGSQGTFEPATFTLTAAKPYQDVVYTSVGNLGARSILAAGNAGTHSLESTTFPIEVVAPIPATQFVVTNVVTAKVGEAVTFNLSTDNPMFGTDAVTYKLTADVPGVFTPATAVLSKSNLNDDISFVPQDSGAVTITITATGSPLLPTKTVAVNVAALPPTYGPGENRYYVGVGRMFPTMASCLAYLNGKNLVEDKASVFIHIAGDVAINGTLSVGQNDVYYTTILPANGKGYRILGTTGKYHYPEAGATITIQGGDFKVPPGTRVREMRMRFSDGSRFNFGGLREGSHLSFLTDNRILVDRLGTGWVIGCGEFGSSLDVSNNVVVAAQPGMTLGLGDGNGSVYGNSFVAIGSGIGGATVGFGYYSNTRGAQIIQNNLFIDCGGSPLTFDNPNAATQYTNKFFNSNYTNNAIAAASSAVLSVGLVASTALNLVLSKTGDLRPADNSPLLGTASTLAVSTNDGAGNNRGFAPDVGAFQRTPATTLPILKATKQVINGQQVVLGVSIVNTVDTLKVVLPGLGDGAAGQGPLPVTFDAEKGEITLQNVSPGSYGSPVFTGSNNGGSTLSTGFLPFVISPIVVNATLADFIGVADTVLAQGRPKLPFRGTVTGPVVDVNPPRISLTANKTNFIEAGSLVLTAEVSDDTGIDRVEFYKGTTLLTTRTVAPWTYTKAMDSTSVAKEDFSAKVFDTAGKSTTSLTIPVYANVPVAGLTAPTVVSVEAVNEHHVVVEFSRAMNKAADFDFAGSGSYALGDHHITNTEWVAGSDTKIRLGHDAYWGMRADEVMTLTYIQNKKRGWRATDGMLVESFTDVPVVNKIAPIYKEPLHHTVTGLAASTPLKDLTWSRGSAVWNSATKFVSNGADGVVPPPDKPVVAGIVRMGQFFNDGYFFQQGLAVFFKLNTVGDSPYGIIMRSDTDNTKLGKGLRVWVTNDGTVRFSHDPQHNTTPVTLPDIKVAPLAIGQEYCLEMQQVDVSGFLMYEYRLSTSANKVRLATLASARFHTTENSGSDTLKVYAVNTEAPPGVVTHFEGPTGYFGAPDYWPQVTLTRTARLTKLSNVVEGGDSTNFTYTGSGSPLSASPGGVFDLMFVNRSNASNGIQAMLTNQVDNLHLGVTFNKQANVVGERLPVERMLIAIRAQAVGKKYEVLVNNKLRATQKQVTIEPGDVVRLRAVGYSVFAEVRKNFVWTKLGFVRQCMGSDGSNDRMYGQLYLPGNSRVELLKN